VPSRRFSRKVYLLSSDEDSVAILEANSSNLDDPFLLVHFIIDPQVANPKLETRQSVGLERLTVSRNRSGLVHQLLIYPVEDKKPLTRVESGQKVPRQR